MANGLVDLIPDIYAAMHVVSRELTGMIAAVTRDTRLENVAIGQEIISPVAPRGVATDVTAGFQPPQDGAQTFGNRKFTIQKARRVPFLWNGEESKGVNNGGPGVLTLQQNQIAEAMRTLVNECEADLCNLYPQFSRAYGTPGTVPFGTPGDYTDASRTLQILKDNGAPLSDLHLVINTDAGATMIGKQSRADERGEVSMQRQGVLIDTAGFAIRESAQIANHTKGTAASATTTNAGLPVGTTVIPLASAGTGTIVAGDIIQLAGDTNKYVVEVGDASVANGGSITIGAPGLRVAVPAAATNITVVGSSARNMAFRRSAIILGHRLPALPPGGKDLAIDRTQIQDPRSGLVFELSMYPGYRQMQYEVAAAWGVGVTNPEHTSLLIG